MSFWISNLQTLKNKNYNNHFVFELIVMKLEQPEVSVLSFKMIQLTCVKKIVFFSFQVFLFFFFEPEKFPVLCGDSHNALRYCDCRNLDFDDVW